MDLLLKIRKYESLHILLWLIKDTCWMLELKWFGAIMMIPTLILAFYLIYKTLGSIELYINTAVFFWISANSFWMMMEFFNNSIYKDYASIPFALGFLFVAIFYYKSLQAKNS